ncbi:lactase-phlorizin hydrolase-like isoform X2 [Lytechinus variegatus]|uniref:lactase-phlorizin hydrolase-like isoform X2 n=1 Tax=Lytechinus variegatus TaxID=7654 RepID=UPI001BB0E4E3|nr:lactase-phlorizin hydrolase-like isoform X2 [Lytechinus variegatus]
MTPIETPSSTLPSPKGSYGVHRRPRTRSKGPGMRTGREKASGIDSPTKVAILSLRILEMLRATATINGTLNNVNEAGIGYYNSLIDELLRNNITSMVTLYHWDLPQALQDVGGWANETVIDHFNDFAELCYQRFGSRVPFWITFNDPWAVSVLGYGSGSLAPGITEDGTTIYVVAHNIIRSHAKAWHTYNDTYRELQNGKVGITLNADHIEPADPTRQDHIDAAERYLQFDVGWWANPIFKNGDYPEIMKTSIAGKSAVQGFNTSRLPEFTQEEMEYNRGTADFFGLNHYTTHYGANSWEDNTNPPSYCKDRGIEISRNYEWEIAGSNPIVPWGIRRILKWIGLQYHVPVYVTENGVSSHPSLDPGDVVRQNYYRAYTNEVLKAIKLDGVDVRGYAVRSLLDSFEWTQGYDCRFGMYDVNFSDSRRPRRARESASVYAHIVGDNGFIKEPAATPGTLNTTMSPMTTKATMTTATDDPGHSGCDDENKHGLKIGSAILILILAVYSISITIAFIRRKPVKQKSEVEEGTINHDYLQPENWVIPEMRNDAYQELQTKNFESFASNSPVSSSHGPTCTTALPRGADDSFQHSNTAPSAVAYANQRVVDKVVRMEASRKDAEDDYAVVPE